MLLLDLSVANSAAPHRSRSFARLLCHRGARRRCRLTGMPPNPTYTSSFGPATPHDLYRQKRDFQRPTVLRQVFTPSLRCPRRLTDTANCLHLVFSRYAILGFLSSGTYGRVYKARVRQHTSEASPAGLLGTPSAATPGKRIKLSRDDGEEEGELVAIKKFKPDKEGEVVTYTGISQSACREIMVSPPCFDEIVHIVQADSRQCTDQPGDPARQCDSAA